MQQQITAIVLSMLCEALMIGSLHLDDELYNKVFFSFTVFNIYVMVRSVYTAMVFGDIFMHVCVCLFTCVFFSFVQPYSRGPQSCRHSVREDRVIHRHERGGPSVHISKQSGSIIMSKYLNMC